MSKSKQFTGAEIVIKALIDHDVEVIFGYPGGAVLPIYDALHKQNKIRHILVRHEQAAVHAAEGYARSTGKVGVVLVTSGPGATNTVTGLADALLDSVPIVCITGQVPSHLIGTDAFQEVDTVGITRSCTKANYLVLEKEDLVKRLQESFYVARIGRPGPVVIDIPKDVQFAKTTYNLDKTYKHPSYNPVKQAKTEDVEAAVEMLLKAKRPIFYGGGGLVNAGDIAFKKFQEIIELLNMPCTLTLQGISALDGDHKNFLGMLGMHGTVEANLAMHECDVMLSVGARFDDRVTGRPDGFSPHSKKIHVDIDPSSINKCIAVDLALVGDCGTILGQVLALLKKHHRKNDDSHKLDAWWKKIHGWAKKKCLHYEQKSDAILPQHAISRIYKASRKSGKDVFVTTEVGQHQMWTAQYFKQHKPRHLMTSGGLGTMGYGFPAAIGVQIANPDALVVCIAGDASILMNIQEMSTVIQYRLPVKVFVINNQWMGMVRQWQELLHEERYSQSYTESLPDFVKLAEAYGWKGICIDNPKRLDNSIREMIDHKGPVFVDCNVENTENCFPMIPSGASHNEMILSSSQSNIGDDGKKMV